MIHDLSQIIAEHPFVRGLSEEQIKFLTGCTANVKFAPEEFLFREGRESNALYLIREGEAELQVYSPGVGASTLATIVGGEIAGWSWAVEPYVSHFDVVAKTDIRAISIDAECLRNKCKTDPAFGYQMLARMGKVMEQRLQSTRLQLMDFYEKRR